MGALTGILLALRGGTAMVPPIVWKILAGVLLLGAVYLAGDVRGRRIEVAKCEARAAAAQKAADAQDLQAEKDAHAQDLQTTNDLKNQKWVDDETIKNLTTKLAARPAGKPCAYDDDTLDPDERATGGLRNGADGQGAGNAKHPRAPFIPLPVAVPKATPGASPFVVAEQRKQVIVKQNRIIVSARDAWSAMRTTYQKSFLKKKFFGGN